MIITDIHSDLCIFLIEKLYKMQQQLLWLKWILELLNFKQDNIIIYILKNVGRSAPLKCRLTWCRLKKLYSATTVFVIKMNFESSAVIGVQNIWNLVAAISELLETDSLTWWLTITDIHFDWCILFNWILNYSNSLYD